MNKPRAVEVDRSRSATQPHRARKCGVRTLIEHDHVSVLTKNDSGNFVYESVLKERVAQSEPIAITANGLHYTLPTDVPGNYVLELRDDKTVVEPSCNSASLVAAQFRARSKRTPSCK